MVTFATAIGINMTAAAASTHSANSRVPGWTKSAMGWLSLRSLREVETDLRLLTGDRAPTWRRFM